MNGGKGIRVGFLGEVMLGLNLKDWRKEGGKERDSREWGSIHKTGC
jgi:hypothetical protein